MYINSHNNSCMHRPQSSNNINNYNNKLNNNNNNNNNNGNVRGEYSDKSFLRRVNNAINHHNNIDKQLRRGGVAKLSLELRKRIHNIYTELTSIDNPFSTNKNTGKLLEELFGNISESRQSNNNNNN
eukprot:Tbor_TRINITY_DN5514_c3_g1::TRINITY_DN5514_c3_g1_i5::g.13365::m.13365